MAGKSANAKVEPPPDRWDVAMPALAILLLVIVAYLPSLRGEFIWDDDFHVTKCEPLRSLFGLWRIWTVPGATQQFYPLTWTSFWIDYHVWGLNPFAYHAENILLHGINAILVWRILRRLAVPGAWFGAALFALHPVCVESVAWVSERKNTLSGLCFLFALRVALEFWLPRRPVIAVKSAELKPVEEPHFGQWKFYWLTVFLFLCALWCKTVTIGLPGVVLLLVWWKRGRWVLKDWLLVIPFVALGLAMGVITASIEHGFVLDAANADEWKISWSEKFIIAGKALWFYLGKLVWPHPLVFIYPRWHLKASQALSYLPLILAFVGGGWLWLRRRTSWAPPVLVAMGCFAGLLLPALGFINIFPFRYSFVADHFQYLAAIAPLALAAAGITQLLARWKTAAARPAILGLILASCGVLTWSQTGIYRNLEVLWRDTLAHNPESWMAHDNLGLYLTETGRFTEAESEYRAAIKIRANDHIAFYDLGLQAAIRGNLEDAIANFNETLALAPSFAMAHYQLANIFMREENPAEAIREYRAALQGIPKLVVGHFNLANALAQKSDIDGAIAQFERTVELQPDYVPARVNLGKMLSSKGDAAGAIQQYQQALKIDPTSVEALANLGNALVAQGKLDDAIVAYRSALELEPNSSIIHFNLSVALSREGKTVEAEAERATAQQLQVKRTVSP